MLMFEPLCMNLSIKISMDVQVCVHFKEFFHRIQLNCSGILFVAFFRFFILFSFVFLLMVLLIRLYSDYKQLNEKQNYCSIVSMLPQSQTLSLSLWKWIVFFFSFVCLAITKDYYLISVIMVRYKVITCSVSSSSSSSFVDTMHVRTEHKRILCVTAASIKFISHICECYFVEVRSFLCVASIGVTKLYKHN